MNPFEDAMDASQPTAPPIAAAPAKSKKKRAKTPAGGANGTQTPKRRRGKKAEVKEEGE